MTFFLKVYFIYLYPIIFQISWCQSDLCSNCNERSLEVYQLRSLQKEKFQNGSKLDPKKSVLDALRTIKRKERSSIECMKEFWGVFWLSFKNEIHNQCLSLWSYVRDFEQILPRLLSFFKLPLKFIKSFWNTFWIMFKGYVWCLNCLIKTFFGNRSSRVSPFSGSYSRYHML